MADDTHAGPLSPEPEVRPIRWCHWCEDVTTDDALLIDAVERISGPPVPIYACAACRRTHSLVPLAEKAT